MKKRILFSLLLCVIAMAIKAQDITVNGTVLSATDSEPLIGASVVSSVKGTNGTTTDFDGNFTLVVPKGSSLTISYIGYVTTTVEAAPNMEIKLKEKQ